MTLKKIFSVVTGFVTIGLLSSAFAKIQGLLVPASMHLFDQETWNFFDTIQLVIKLGCVYISCITGGLITSLSGGENKQHYMVGISIMLVVGWLWISTVHPTWFWLTLLVGILPSVILGSKMRRTAHIK